MGRLVTRQTILFFCFFFLSHLNLGAWAGFALANCDWLGRTIAFHQVFFQQGRVALDKWCIGPQKGHARTPGMNFFCTVPRPHFPGRALIWPGCFSEYVLGLFWLYSSFQSLWDSFLYLGKLHWFLYLLLSYFYDPGMFILCRRKWHLVFPTLYIIIVDRVNLNKLLQIITKLRWSNKDNNN